MSNIAALDTLTEIHLYRLSVGWNLLSPVEKNSRIGGQEGDPQLPSTPCERTIMSLFRVSIAELENEVKMSEERLASAKVDLQRAKVMRSQGKKSARNQALKDFQESAASLGRGTGYRA